MNIFRSWVLILFLSGNFVWALPREFATETKGYQLSCERLLSGRNQDKATQYILPALRNLSESKIYSISSHLKSRALLLFGLRKEERDFKTDRLLEDLALFDPAQFASPYLGRLSLGWEGGEFLILRDQNIIARFPLADPPAQVYAWEKLNITSEGLQKMIDKGSIAPETKEPINVGDELSPPVGLLLSQDPEIKVYLQIGSSDVVQQFIVGVDIACDRLADFDESPDHTARYSLTRDGVRCRFEVFKAGWQAAEAPPPASVMSY